VSASRSFVESAVWNGTAARAAVVRAVSGEASISAVWPILNAYVLEQSFKARAKMAIHDGPVGATVATKTTAAYADGRN